ncbi:MAG: hypothetical protein R6U64_00180 [Bacteroidales bacterium]
MNHFQNEDTICAPATAPGIAAISVIRLSGSKSEGIMSQLFVPSGKKRDFKELATHHVTLGNIMEEGDPVDEVLVTRFQAPHTYTGEDLVL